MSAVSKGPFGEEQRTESEKRCICKFALFDGKEMFCADSPRLWSNSVFVFHF